MEDFRTTLDNDSRRRLHKIVVHMSSAASAIEDFGPNMLAIGYVSELMREKFGITIWKLRDLADWLMEVEKQEEQKALRFEEYLNEKKP